MTLATLHSLSAEAWAAWDAALATVPNVVVRPAMPILYFGDANAYATSDIRIATVGLNPSLAEFPGPKGFRRFPAAAGDRDGTRDPELYVKALDDYFRRDPLREWFRYFDKVLHGLDASYYDGRHRTAVHTDLCSPVPTNPTWSKLARQAQAQLLRSGRELWHRLINTLRPDVLLVSVAEIHLADVRFQQSAWQEVHHVDRTNPYTVRARKMTLDDGHQTLLVFGRAANTPFGTVKDVDKTAIGRSVLESLHG